MSTFFDSSFEEEESEAYSRFDVHSGSARRVSWADEKEEQEEHSHSSISENENSTDEAEDSDDDDGDDDDSNNDGDNDIDSMPKQPNKIITFHHSKIPSALVNILLFKTKTSFIGIQLC